MFTKSKVTCQTLRWFLDRHLRVILQLLVETDFVRDHAYLSFCWPLWLISLLTYKLWFRKSLNKWRHRLLNIIIIRFLRACCYLNLIILYLYRCLRTYEGSWLAIRFNRWIHNRYLVKLDLFWGAHCLTNFYSFLLRRYALLRSNESYSW